MSSEVAGCQILVIGLDPYRVPGPWDPEPVADAIEVGMAGLTSLGIDAEKCLVGLDGDDDIEARVTAALQARQWDYVVVGGGIRKPEELLELFESIVNLVHRYAPRAQISFNSSPQDLRQAVARRLTSG